jgi:hypothetical protein
MIRILTIAMVSIALASGPGWSDGNVTPGPNFLDVSIQTSRSGEAAAGEGGAGGLNVTDGRSTIAYETQLLCGDADQDLRFDTFECDSAMIRCGEGDRGLMYNVTAIRPGGSSELVGTGCYLPQEVAAQEVIAPPRPHVTPALVLRAFERVPLPESELVVQPPGGQTLVGLDTIFSTRAERFIETVTLLGRSVELDISPTSYRWSHGDSTGQTTDWPGQEWRQGRADSRYVTHLYEDRMRVTTSVDTTWSARYRVGNGPWQDVPGTVTIEGDPAPLRVRSASPHLVGVSDRS